MIKAVLSAVSRDALLRIFAPPPPEHIPSGRVQWHPGWVEFRAWGMNRRIVPLPLMAPLPGTRFGEYAKIPNPFEITSTPWASAARGECESIE